MQSEIFIILGGAKALDFQVNKDADFDLLIKKGFPWKAANFLKKSLHLTDIEFAQILGVSDRTLRRLRKEHKRLSSEGSDRLYRLARIYSVAKEALGDDGNAIEWLHKPQVGLGERIPLKLIETDAGANEVRNLLGRIEHGVLT